MIVFYCIVGEENKGGRKKGEPEPCVRMYKRQAYSMCHHFDCEGSCGNHAIALLWERINQIIHILHRIICSLYHSANLSDVENRFSFNH